MSGIGHPGPPHAEGRGKGWGREEEAPISHRSGSFPGKRGIGGAGRLTCDRVTIKGGR